MRKLLLLFMPRVTENMKAAERNWRWDPKLGWVSVHTRCGAQFCQCLPRIIPPFTPVGDAVYSYQPLYPIGTRVVVIKNFHVGARGEVVGRSIAPNLMWVLRDGSSEAIIYSFDELEEESAYDG